MTYVRNAAALHRGAKQRRTLELLQRASSRQAMAEEEMSRVTQERRRLVHTVSRVSRSANFRLQVLQAYAHRCAVTRAQLGVVEAAHILPVVAPGSVDDVRNGIALSPTYHRAFDYGLIYMGTDYRMRINSRMVSQLRESERDGGLAEFQSSLGRIHLPPDRRQWPDMRFVQEANRYRGVD